MSDPNEHYDGQCLICHELKPVRHKNIYLIGSEGTDMCMDCERDMLRYLRDKMRYYTLARKEKWKKFKKKKI